MSSVPLCTAPITSSRNYTKLYNSLGQSPCYIATALGNACDTGGAPFTLPSLNTSQHVYPGSSAADANNTCLCSTVHYSLLSACSFCQTLDWLAWSNYIYGSCITVSSSLFPKPIPTGKSVPHYAYLNVTAGGTLNFDVAAAISAGGAESSPISTISSATSTVSTGSSTTFTVSAITSSTGSDSPKGRSTVMIGAIVGLGVGFVLLVLVVGLVWFCKLRRKAISVQRFPSEHSLTSVKPHSRQSVDQCSVLSAAQYSLLAPPPGPQPLEMTLEDIK